MSIWFKIEDGVLLKYEGTDSVVIIPEGTEKSARMLSMAIMLLLKLPCRVSCNTEGQCFIIEIDENKNVRAKKFVSGNLCFCRKNIDVTAGEMETVINRELADIDDNRSIPIISRKQI